MRLRSGALVSEGRVEVQNNRYWGTICDDHWTIREANVVCRSMGYGTAEIATKNAYYGRGIGKVLYHAQETLSSTFTIIYTQWYFLFFYLFALFLPRVTVSGEEY